MQNKKVSFMVRNDKLIRKMIYRSLKTCTVSMKIWFRAQEVPFFISPKLLK